MTIITLSPRFESSSLGRPSVPGSSSGLTAASGIILDPNLHSNTLNSAEGAKAEREFWALRQNSDSRQDLLADKYLDEYGFPLDLDFDCFHPGGETAGCRPSIVRPRVESQPQQESEAQLRRSLRTGGTEMTSRLKACLRRSAKGSRWIVTAMVEAYVILQLWIL